MRVELLAGTAGVLFADLTEIVFRQMYQHVLPVLKSGLALRTGMSQRVVSVVRLEMSGQVFPERFEVLQRGSALTAEQSTRGVTALGRSGMFAREIGRLRGGLISSRALLASGALRVPVATVDLVHELSTVQWAHASILAVLEDVMFRVGCRGGTRYSAEWAHHQRGTETVGSVDRDQVIPERAQRGELHGALVAGETVLVEVLLHRSGRLLLVLPLVILGRSLGPMIQRFLALVAELLVASAWRRWHRHVLTAKDRLVHRVHVHL